MVAAVAPRSSTSGPARGCRSSSPSSTSPSSWRRSCSPSPSATACSSSNTAPTALVYVYAAVPLVLSLFVPLYTAPSRRIGARLRDHRRRCCSSASTCVLFWYAFRLPSRSQLPARRLLRLGQLLRHHRAGAGVELRQLALRHAAGEAAVRADRRRARRSARSPAGCWRGIWSGRSAARSTCCWCWPR